MFYLLARRLNNYGIVDIVWSYAFAGLALFYAFFGPGWLVRKALIATMATLLGVAFFVVCLNPAPQIHPLEIGGVVLWLLALTGESLADAQLAAFKRDPTSKGRVCDVGLWHYSRHPNYFFEWLIWVAYFLFALGSPYGWVAVIGPASMLYLLLRVTGIPLTEQQSLRSKGDAYRRYQQTTSAFIPWFPKVEKTKD